MVDDEPTLPDLRAQNAQATPTWPLPQPQAPEGRHIWRGVLLFVVVALLSFGVVRGVTIVLAQANGATTAPLSGSNPYVAPTHPPAPRHPPTSVPIVNPPASTVTPAAVPTETAQPTPTSGGGGD